jgi:hypothetical protein
MSAAATTHLQQIQEEIMTEFVIDDSVPILVDITDVSGGGLEYASRGGRAERLEEVSNEAMNRALSMIKKVGDGLKAVADEVPDDMTKIEIGFGVNFAWEAGKVVAKIGSEATINVNMTWEQSEDDESPTA